MALYIDEEQVWKCPKHPSRRRRSGICPKCLHDRLVTLCPNCANALPCPECPAPIEITSSTSPFSLFSFSRGGSRHDFSNNNETNRPLSKVEGDPVLRKSRSVAISFLRSKSKHVGNATDRCEIENPKLVNENEKVGPVKVSRSKINFWSVIRVNKSKKSDVNDEVVTKDGLNKCDDLTKVNDDLTTMMKRSRSVAVNGNGFGRPKGWYFSSPIKSFRQSKLSTSVAVA